MTAGIPPWETARERRLGPWDREQGRGRRCWIGVYALDLEGRPWTGPEAGPYWAARYRRARGAWLVTWRPDGPFSGHWRAAARWSGELTREEVEVCLDVRLRASGYLFGRRLLLGPDAATLRETVASVLAGEGVPASAWSAVVVEETWAGPGRREVVVTVRPGLLSEDALRRAYGWLSAMANVGVTVRIDTSEDVRW